MGITLKVMTSNSTRTTLDALVPAWEKATGNTVEIHADSAKRMTERITGGDHGDLVVLGKSAVDELAALGIVAPATVRAFASAVVGVGVKAGSPRPDVSSVDAFRRSLLAAKSVAHTVHGASGMYIPVLFEKLGIAAEMKPKTVTRPGGYIGRVVMEGEAEVAMQQISELLAVPGLELVGPIPAAVQKTFRTSAGLFAGTSRAAEAESLLKAFAAPEAAAVFRAKGLEPA